MESRDAIMESTTSTAARQPAASEQTLQSQSSTKQTPSRKLSRHNSQNLSLDLTDLPPLIPPSPPSNTLLITNLMDPSIFHPASLATIRENISRTAELHSFSPLKSFRRIVASFYSVDDAIAIMQQLDGENILGARVRVFFGTNTPVNLSAKDRHLAAPAAEKLFFISPPPSPPHGWEMRNEEPPNKEVHADDLAAALSKLHAKTHAFPDAMNPEEGEGQDEVMALASPISPARSDFDGAGAGKQQQQQQQQPDRRMRSGSTTLVYHPKHHGDSPTLPAVMVEDTTNQDEDDSEDRRIMAHTARPPTELMDQS